MLTRAKLKEGERESTSYNPEIGRALRRRNMGDDDACTRMEKNFHKIFYQMEDKVDKFFADNEKRMKNEKHLKEEDNASVRKGGG